MTLTPRQATVAAGIAAGLCNKTIARELGISHHTVKHNVAAVLAKLGVSRRGEVAGALGRDCG